MKRLFWLILFGSAAFFGASLAFVQTPQLTPRALGHPIGTVATDLGRLADQFEITARQCAPAVVYVEASKPSNSTATGSAGKPLEESGSGVLVRSEFINAILVLTNNHVIAHARPQQITVSLADGRLYHPGRVWADPESDVALLRLDGPSNLPALPLGNSDQVRIGQWVLAIGSPFGLNQTVTHGIISARERGQISLGSTIRIKDFLQTDAAINPGSSGGPLLNLQGEVIGINTAIASQNGNNSGIAFSIPVNLVKLVMRQLLENGNVARGYLGMQLAQSFEPADALKLGLDRVQGALVEIVYPNTPAAEAGLRPNDVVTEVDGVTIRNENHLINLISGSKAGKKIQVRVWRDRRDQSIQAVIGDWSAGKERFRPQS